MTAVPVSGVSRRFSALTEGLAPTYWFLWVGMLINRAGSFVLPMITVYLTQARKLSLGEAGAVVSLFGLGSLCGSTLGGVLADRIGRRTTLLTSLVLGAISMLALGAAVELWQLATAVLFLGLTGDMFRPAMQAIVADVVEPPYRMKAFSYQYWAINLGFSFAAVVGGVMATRNFTALFIGDAATTLIFAALVWRYIPETRPAPTTGADQGSLATPYIDLKFLPFLVLSFGTALIFFQHLTALPVDMRAKGLSSSDFGLAIAANGVLIVLLQPSVTRWLGGLPRGVILAVATAFVGVGFGLTAWAGSLPFYVLTVIVWTLGEILMAPVNASIVADLAPVQLRGRYQGAYNLTWSLALLVAPVASPALIAKTGMSAFWLVCFVFGLTLSLGHLLITTRTAAPKMHG